MTVLLILLAQTFNPSVAELAESASDLYENGWFIRSSDAWSLLLSRIPHLGRATYNLAASFYMQDSLAVADSILSMEITGIQGDTLLTARSVTSLAVSIEAEDYGGVEVAVDELKTIVSSGTALLCASTSLEAGLNWLDHHEPSEDQQDQSEDQQDQNDDQQDQSEDQQDQSEDQQDQSEDQQDQNEDQQDQSEDQQDQNEDQQDQSEDQQDQNEDQQDQSEDQQDQNRIPPSDMDEMTPEQAQAILDLVEDEQSPDSVRTVKSGYPAGPIW